MVSDKDDLTKLNLEKIRPRGHEIKICPECGFDDRMIRKTIFLKNSVTSLMADDNARCETCGHYKDGSTIVKNQQLCDHCQRYKIVPDDFRAPGTDVLSNICTNCMIKLKEETQRILKTPEMQKLLREVVDKIIKKEYKKFKEELGWKPKKSSKKRKKK